MGAGDRYADKASRLAKVETYETGPGQTLIDFAASRESFRDLARQMMLHFAMGEQRIQRGTTQTSTRQNFLRRSKGRLI